MDWTIPLAGLGLLLAGIIKGATGLGYSSCALPFLVSAVGLKAAIVLLVVPAMLSNVFLMFNTGHLRETLDRFWLLYAATPAGIAVGVLALAWIDQRVATRTLGVITVFYAVLALARGLERPLQVPVGLLNGFFTGLTGSQMMPLLPYMLALRLDPDRLVQANNVAVTLASAFLAVGLVTAGLMTWPTAALSGLAVIPALGGVQLGTWARRHIPIASFRVIVLALLVVMGFMLAARP